MARYFTQKPGSRAFFVEDEHYARPQDHIPSVCEHEPTDTGLLDANGDKIMKQPRAIGFGRRDEW